MQLSISPHFPTRTMYLSKRGSEWGGGWVFSLCVLVSYQSLWIRKVNGCGPHSVHVNEVCPGLAAPLLSNRLASKRTRANSLRVFIRFFRALRRPFLFIREGATANINRQGRYYVPYYVRFRLRNCHTFFYGLIHVKGRVCRGLLWALRVHPRLRCLAFALGWRLVNQPTYLNRKDCCLLTCLRCVTTLREGSSTINLRAKRVRCIVS